MRLYRIQAFQRLLWELKAALSHLRFILFIATLVKLDLFIIFRSDNLLIS